MTKAIILTVIAGSLSFMIGCGGANTEKETLKPQTNVTATDTNVSNPPATTRNDGDADDVRTSDQTLSSNSNANRASKSSDRDDSKTTNKQPVSNRRNNPYDDDDRGKKDSDGDNDDR